MRLGEVQNVTPRGYRADLTLDPEKTTFSGSIVITMDLAKPVQTLWLNQAKIHIVKAVLKTAGKTLNAQVLPGGEDFVGLRFGSAVAAGSAVVTIDYTGAIEEKNSSGIFRRRQNDNWYLFTQFEATDARAAFPCFDEPSYKTPWQLMLHIPAKNSAISNTPVASQTTASNVKTVVFRETKPLPSYLVAFGVGPFEYVNAGVAGRNKVPVRIVTAKGEADEAKFAAEVTAKILTRLEDYFGIPYPYEKADQVALANTSGFGAMENAGMVTYQQSILLANPKVDTIERQRRYVVYAAHELAHQWFGNLVTTAWWDDIWLNEAFATWMERKITAEWNPAWQTRVSDIATILRAEQADSLTSARKIRQEIRTKDDINNAFDDITYEKGATVIGMFESWMGPEEFRKGVQAYMKQYAFRTTTAGDFLDSLSSSSGKNVTKAFSTFLNQAGLPLISVALECKGGAQPVLNVKQTRSLAVASKENTAQVWNVPFCFRYGTGATGQSQCALITQPAETIALTSAKGCPAWVEANDKAAGYYRVLYQGGLAAALTAGDVQGRLSAAERAEFLGNAEALAKANKLPAASVLALVETFHADPSRSVLESALALALAPRLQLVPDNLAPNYRRFLLKNFQARARELGWTAKASDSEDTRLLRATLVRPIATTAGDEELASQAKTLTERWFADHGALSPDIAEAVLGTAAFHGDRKLFDRFLAEFAGAKDKQIRGELIAAMYSFRDPASIEAGMNALVSGKIPFIEGSRLLFGGSQAPSTRMLSLNFLEKNWDRVVAAMPTQGGFDFGAQLPRAGTYYCDAGSRDRLKAFFGPRVGKFVGAGHALDEAVERIEACIGEKAAQAGSVAGFLGKY